MNLSKLFFIAAIMCFSLTVYADKGKAIYDSSCKMCHESGMAGAPKTGDKSAWEDRLAGGVDYLVKSAIEGKQGYAGIMPPRGGNPNLSDQDVRDAVSYMVSAVK